ncbi:hypothetical protein Cgig2_009158 [Carnegiea gigantea]|uniref:RRM domain-containing protein n=1 Tax=Carnegiea gigantea TaxID=171969 RepID=A0A9Q1KF27_9CARY|nr:hypothetical protein Cgig2_009158 [Carnegiea gigantea]
MAASMGGVSRLRLSARGLKAELRDLILSIAGDKRDSRHLERKNAFLAKPMPLPLRSPSNQTKWPNSARTEDHQKLCVRKHRYEQLYSVFIDNSPSNISVVQLHNEFASFGNVIDTYIPDKVTKRSGRKFNFVRFKSREYGEKLFKQPMRNFYREV